jgi:hypothetical protein
MSKAWNGAVQLVGRISVCLGMVLVVIGFTKATLLLIQSSRSVETLATIDAASARGVGYGSLVDLSWQDLSGATQRAVRVPISYDLGRKLRLGGRLSRAQLKIRYQLANNRLNVLVVDDLPERLKTAAALAIRGFLAISVGSALILGMMLFGGPSGGITSAWHRAALQPDSDNR